LIALLILFAAPQYLWPVSPARSGTIESRFTPPDGARRIDLPADSFGAWLRTLPLLPPNSPVLLYDGSPKARQDVHAAVVDLDVGTRDLQQWADAVMRLRAEYLRSRKLPIVFHPDRGKELRFGGGDFHKFLIKLFADAGTASLSAEMKPIGKTQLVPGDVLIQGGYPGHAVLVLDAADGADGKRHLLIGQSYMPAQQFHVVKNPAGGVWFDADALDGSGIKTPEWRPFLRRDARRF
jgi:hypothetical protein